MDPRIKTLAKNLITYSVDLKPGEKVLIEVFDNGHPLAKALVDEAYRAGGLPFLTIKNNQLHRSLLRQASVEQLTLIGQWEAERMKNMDAYIGIRASENLMFLQKKCKPISSIGASPFTWISGFLILNGASCVIPMAAWLNWQTAARMLSRTSSLMSATWIMPKWQKQWIRPFPCLSVLIKFALSALAQI